MPAPAQARAFPTACSPQAAPPARRTTNEQLRAPRPSLSHPPRALAWSSNLACTRASHDPGQAPTHPWPPLHGPARPGPPAEDPRSRATDGRRIQLGPHPAVLGVMQLRVSRPRHPSVVRALNEHARICSDRLSTFTIARASHSIGTIAVPPRRWPALPDPRNRSAVRRRARHLAGAAIAIATCSSRSSGRAPTSAGADRCRLLGRGRPARRRQPPTARAKRVTPDTDGRAPRPIDPPQHRVVVSAARRQVDAAPAIPRNDGLFPRQKSARLQIAGTCPKSHGPWISAGIDADAHRAEGRSGSRSAAAAPQRARARARRAKFTPLHGNGTRRAACVTLAALRARCATP